MAVVTFPSSGERKVDELVALSLPNILIAAVAVGR
jgi:hypothetical protein